MFINIRIIFTALFLTVFSTSLVDAQIEGIKIPLLRNFEGDGVAETIKDNVSITKWKGLPCARFVPDDLGKLDDDKYGLEYTSDDIYTLLNSRKMSFAMMFFCLAPHEIEATFDRRILQIGARDNDFAFRQKEYDKSKGTYKIECRAYNDFYDKSTVDLKFGKWYTIYFDVWDIECRYSITELSTGQTIYSKSKLLNNPSLSTKDLKITFGNKEINSVDQLNGGVSQVLFATGYTREEVFWGKSDDAHQVTFGWKTRLKTTLYSQEGYKINALSTLIRTLQPEDTISYSVKADQPKWIVQGHILQEDEYSNFSKNGDSMSYDAWIDRGNWVTVQSFLPSFNLGDAIYSNILRVYIEENLTNTDRIDVKEIKIADDGKSLKLLNITQPVLEMSVYSLDGKKMISVENQSKISTHSLPNAVYILDYKTADKVHHTVRFAK